MNLEEVKRNAGRTGAGADRSLGHGRLSNFGTPAAVKTGMYVKLELPPSCLAESEGLEPSSGLAAPL